MTELNKDLRKNLQQCLFSQRGKGRLFMPFPAVSQLLPVLQIHLLAHANICTHLISLSQSILRHSGLPRALFQVLPVPEFYFRSNIRDQKWNANKSVSLAPGIISPQCCWRASSRDFTAIVCKMAAITTSGSGFDCKFGLVAPGFLLGAQKHEKLAKNRLSPKKHF